MTPQPIFICTTPGFQIIEETQTIAGLGEPFAPGAPTPWPDDLVKRRIGFSCLARPAPYTTCVESCRAGEERW